MAQPPFSLDETSPGDSDIVSQFPANERAFRDNVEDWLLVNHNTQGHHDEVTLTFATGGAPAGDTGATTIWADATGALKQRVGTGTISDLVPVVPAGVIWDFAGDVAPTGWLLCDGAAISRTTFAGLFSTIGITYGGGDGSTTFNLPDFRGRVAAGKDNMGGTSANRLTGLSGGLNGDVLGATGGAETHTLTEAQIPAHTHTITDPGHIHSVPLGEGPQITQGAENHAANTGPTNTASAVTGITINSTGGGGAHNNVQPTLVVNKIIKT